MSQSVKQYPQTVDDFNRVTSELRAAAGFREPLLFSIGRRVFTGGGTLASVRYPVVNGPGQNLGTAAILIKILGVQLQGVQNVTLNREQIYEAVKYFAPFEKDEKRHENIEVIKRALSSDVLRSHESGNNLSNLVATFIFDDVEPIGVEDSTLKLYGLSNRHFKPNQLNLIKIFTKLPNVSWHGDVPMDEGEIAWSLMDAAFSNGTPYAPHMVDKFPLYIHRINAIKMGVRVTDQHKVRLGAYLGEGTTLMPGASYVNFNAGTEGSAIVEGRISSSAWVGEGTDVGGGASMLGVLSGGNERPVSTGRNCLLEANCVLGIDLGDACIVAADTAILASTLVEIKVENHPKFGETVKAGELSGINAVTFRSNSMSGKMEVVRTKRNCNFARKLKNGESILNADLHQNN